MVQYTSWKGKITRWYEQRLGLSGGYVRKRWQDLEPSIRNSEYVKSTEDALVVHAQSGKKVTPTLGRISPHHNNFYGNDQSAMKLFRSNVKKRFEKRKKMLRRR